MSMPFGGNYVKSDCSIYFMSSYDLCLGVTMSYSMLEEIAIPVEACFSSVVLFDLYCWLIASIVAVILLPDFLKTI